MTTPRVILISAATGAGKSTSKQAFAHRLGWKRMPSPSLDELIKEGDEHPDILRHYDEPDLRYEIPLGDVQEAPLYNLESTDIIRARLRTMENTQFPQIFSGSSFDSNRPAEYDNLHPEEKARATLDTYRVQANAMRNYITSAVSAALRHSKDNLMLEGVFIVPGMLKGSEIDEEFGDHIYEMFIDVPDEFFHRRNLEQRGKDNPARSADRYVKNLFEIRVIQDYLRAQAREYSTPTILNTRRNTHEKNYLVHGMVELANTEMALRSAESYSRDVDPILSQRFANIRSGVESKLSRIVDLRSISFPEMGEAGKN